MRHMRTIHVFFVVAVLTMAPILSLTFHVLPAAAVNPATGQQVTAYGAFAINWQSMKNNLASKGFTGPSFSNSTNTLQFIFNTSGGPVTGQGTVAWTGTGTGTNYTWDGHSQRTYTFSGTYHSQSGYFGGTGTWGVQDSITVHFAGGDETYPGSTSQSFTWDAVADATGHMQGNITMQGVQAMKFSAQFTPQPLAVQSDVAGVVADGSSSAAITVTLPAAGDATVTLTDGAAAMSTSASGGLATFTYVPDPEQLGIPLVDIPAAGTEITLTAATSDGATGNATLRIFRPPVLLVHGLWSGSHMWDKMVQRLAADGFTVYTVDYPNVDSPARIAIMEFAGKIQTIRQEYLAQGINASSVDVIGHSMGGVVARHYINQYQGGPDVDINTLITVGTPHRGSPWPQIYYGWVNARSNLEMGLLLAQHYLPEGSMGKMGPALVDLMPDSGFLRQLNSQPLNPHVDYYAICGTYNLLSNICLLDIYDNLDDYERAVVGQTRFRQLVQSIAGGSAQTIRGDGVVELSSQRFAERISEGYYVNAWHCGEGGNRGVYEISSHLLTGRRQEISQAYRQPSLPSIKVSYFYATSDMFELIRLGYIQGITDDTLTVGDTVEPGDSIDIMYDSYSTCKDDYAWVKLQVTDQGATAGTVFVRLCFPRDDYVRLKPFVRIDILSPQSFHVHNPYEGDVQARIVYGGAMSVVTDTGLFTSPDPDLVLSLDDANNTQVALLEGEVTAYDAYNGSAAVQPGQMVELPGDAPMQPPVSLTSSDMTRWWAADLQEHVLCTWVDAAGQPDQETSSFTIADAAHSLLRLENVSHGDVVTWQFTGPGNLSHESSYTADWSGEGWCSSWVNLSDYGSEARGDWTLDVMMNQEPLVTAGFTVADKSSTPAFELLLGLVALMMLAFIRKKRGV